MAAGSVALELCISTAPGPCSGPDSGRPTQLMQAALPVSGKKVCGRNPRNRESSEVLMLDKLEGFAVLDDASNLLRESRRLPERVMGSKCFFQNTSGNFWDPSTYFMNNDMFMSAQANRNA